MKKARGDRTRRPGAGAHGLHQFASSRALPIGYAAEGGGTGLDVASDVLLRLTARVQAGGVEALSPRGLEVYSLLLMQNALGQLAHDQAEVFLASEGGRAVLLSLVHLLRGAAGLVPGSEALAPEDPCGELVRALRSFSATLAGANAGAHGGQETEDAVRSEWSKLDHQAKPVRGRIALIAKKLGKDPGHISRVVSQLGLKSGTGSE